MISQARVQLAEEFEKKRAEGIIKKKIEKSAALSQVKIRKMAERNKLMENIKSEAAERLTSLIASDRSRYAALLKDLILQVRAVQRRRDC